MYWIKNVTDLSYYNTLPDVPCYCYQLNDAEDLRLHGILDYNGSLANYTATVTMYQPDGVTVIGGITGSFTFNYAKNPNGQHFFIANLNSIPQAFCSNPCFILKVEIKTGNILYFSYFTDQYCAPIECCDTPTGITILQTGTLQPQPNFTGFNPNTPTIGITGVVSQTSNNADPCAKPNIRLETFSDCFDNVTQKWYQTINGKRYTNVFNIEGRFRMLPYEVQRLNSLNCRLQQSQVQKLYELEGFVIFTQPVMEEITDALACKYIFIDGNRYEMATGTPFELIKVGNVCEGTYKLKAQFQSCIAKQIYGCGGECTTTNSLAFLQPIVVNQGNGNYYSEGFQFIGTTVDDLVNYYQTQPNVTSVTVLDQEDYNCEFEVGIIVESDGYIPTSFYYGGIQGINRIFGDNPNNLDVCDIVTPACAWPKIGAITNDEYVCAMPVIGAITNEEVASESLYMTGFGDWALNSNISTRTQNTVALKFEVENPNITYDSGDPDAEIPVIAMQVAYVSAAGWPTMTKQITQAEAPSLPADAIVTIQTDGKIFYSGTVTFADLTGSKVSITDIIYLI